MDTLESPTSQTPWIPQLVPQIVPGALGPPQTSLRDHKFPNSSKLQEFPDQPHVLYTGYLPNLVPDTADIPLQPFLFIF